MYTRLQIVLFSYLKLIKVMSYDILSATTWFT